jgi:septum formation topological specificity factor MinE
MKKHELKALLDANEEANRLRILLAEERNAVDNQRCTITELQNQIAELKGEKA